MSILKSSIANLGIVNKGIVKGDLIPVQPVFSGTIPEFIGVIDQTTSYDASPHYTNSPTSYSIQNAPAGITVSSSGVISSTPTESGLTFNVTITGTNSAGSAVSNTFAVNVAANYELNSDGTIYGTLSEPITYLAGTEYSVKATFKLDSLPASDIYILGDTATTDNYLKISSAGNLLAKIGGISNDFGVISLDTDYIFLFNSTATDTTFTLNSVIDSTQGVNTTNCNLTYIGSYNDGTSAFNNGTIYSVETTGVDLPDLLANDVGAELIESDKSDWDTDISISVNGNTYTFDYAGAYVGYLKDSDLFSDMESEYFIIELDCNLTSGDSLTVSVGNNNSINLSQNLNDNNVLLLTPSDGDDARFQLAGSNCHGTINVSIKPYTPVSLPQTLTWKFDEGPPQYETGAEIGSNPPNADFDDGLTGWTSNRLGNLSVTDGVLTYTGNGGYTNISEQLQAGSFVLITADLAETAQAGLSTNVTFTSIIAENDPPGIYSKWIESASAQYLFFQNYAGSLKLNSLSIKPYEGTISDGLLVIPTEQHGIEADIMRPDEWTTGQTGITPSGTSLIYDGTQNPGQVTIGNSGDIYSGLHYLVNTVSDSTIGLAKINLGLNPVLPFKSNGFYTNIANPLPSDQIKAQCYTQGFDGVLTANQVKPVTKGVILTGVTAEDYRDLNIITHDSAITQLEAVIDVATITDISSSFSGNITSYTILNAPTGVSIDNSGNITIDSSVDGLSFGITVVASNIYSSATSNTFSIMVLPEYEVELTGTQYFEMSEEVVLASDFEFDLLIRTTDTDTMTLIGDSHSLSYFINMNATSGLIGFWVENFQSRFEGAAIGLNDDEAHKITFKLVGAALSLYVDDDLKQTNTITPYTGTNNFRIGSANSVTTSNFIGTYYSVKITDNHTATPVTYEWKFDEGGPVYETGAEQVMSDCYPPRGNTTITELDNGCRATSLGTGTGGVSSSFNSTIGQVYIFSGYLSRGTFNTTVYVRVSNDENMASYITQKELYDPDEGEFEIMFVAEAAITYVGFLVVGSVVGQYGDMINFSVKPYEGTISDGNLVIPEETLGWQPDIMQGDEWIGVDAGVSVNDRTVTFSGTQADYATCEANNVDLYNGLYYFNLTAALSVGEGHADMSSQPTAPRVSSGNYSYCQNASNKSIRVLCRDNGVTGDITINKINPVPQGLISVNLDDSNWSKNT